MSDNTDTDRPDSLTENVRRFFYTEEVPYGLALIRILLPLILLFVVVPRWMHARELYSADGAPAPLALGYGVEDFLPTPTGTTAVVMMTGLVFSLVTSCIGWHTRISLGIACVLYTCLNLLDSLSTMTKYSVISSHLLFLLMLSSCGAIWSVDSLRRRRNTSSEAAGELQRGPAWPRRLMQLLIGIIYFGASFTKLHTAGFLSGDQIRFWLLTDMNGRNSLGEWLALYPWAIVTMSHIALIWQVLFLFLAWRGRFRIAMLSLGVLFHLSTIWLLGLSIFPPIMIATYFAWLNENDVRRLRQLKNRLLPAFGSGPGTLRTADRLQSVRLPAFFPRVPSSVVFAFALVGVTVIGVELEYRLDPYGQRRPEGPYILQPLSSERVAELFRNDETMHEADRFFSLELGTETLAGTLISRRDSFRTGEQLIAQCCLVPPHEDLWLKCRFEDDIGREIHESGQAVTRDMLRADFRYQIPEQLPTGRYRFVIRSNGEDVLARTIHVTGSAGSAVLTN